jgi:hypothetical protein
MKSPPTDKPMRQIVGFVGMGKFEPLSSGHIPSMPLIRFWPPLLHLYCHGYEVT